MLSARIEIRAYTNTIDVTMMRLRVPVIEYAKLRIPIEKPIASRYRSFFLNEQLSRCASAHP